MKYCHIVRQILSLSRIILMSLYQTTAVEERNWFEWCRIALCFYQSRTIENSLTHHSKYIEHVTQPSLVLPHCTNILSLSTIFLMSFCQTSAAEVRNWFEKIGIAVCFYQSHTSGNSLTHHSKYIEHPTWPSLILPNCTINFEFVNNVFNEFLSNKRIWGPKSV